MPTSRPRQPLPRTMAAPPRGPATPRPRPRPERPPHRPSPRVRRRRTLLALTAVAAVVFLAFGPRATKRPTANTPVPPHLVPHDPVSAQLAAAEFAPGACVGMPPTNGDRHVTVFLDAGHGGPDPGAAGYTTSGLAVYERALTLPVVLDAAAMLRAAGYRVVVSRTIDTSVARLGPGDLTSSGSLSLHGEHADIEARAMCANLSQADVLLSVHYNAFSDPTAHGLLTTYDDSRPFATKNQRLAQLVDAGILSSLHGAGWQVPDRGSVVDTTVGAPALSEEAHAY